MKYRRTCISRSMSAWVNTNSMRTRTHTRVLPIEQADNGEHEEPSPGE